ncbi:hypothetical protein A2630_00870 [Candidatus Woesebacteria bacterium RIFCSPHIGHO2_01_FULL_44_10]|uniref:FCP1 homology domain-containing protein n=1 Tax=Candidatus Woesebacteria bacterium RIFCSPLOWO2_01_FULL_44_14 TaxID=1802525 RepID=A0A1F8C1L6_9BACT|nr:MAG: hypothetical protein A2630_00870 [Candidatus Woesebacteria bacterium RIFCSPHIGHO2_01_FULL_44_10]OGM54326.1 MAG: hypothetical protein A3F62_01055 [Candidatus Woesebacteria bacterium RIFCSPHIGHO2_12_FULL_44_11]OGM70227.1 MAG: hypothetical protein A2975_04105 [Candidatus Woesebacteria bacterium RIFCSPLOWO2_01_FULL_44_14]
MIRALITDVSRVLLFPKDRTYTGSLNDLYKEESLKPNYKFFNYFELNEELLKFYKSLKGRVDVHILTSDIIQDAPELKPFWKDVIGKIFSASKMNTHKSTPDAYEKVIKELNLAPHEVIYVDDSNENLEAAKKVGLQTVLYQINEKSLSQMGTILRK